MEEVIVVEDQLHLGFVQMVEPIEDPVFTSTQRTFKNNDEAVRFWAQFFAPGTSSPQYWSPMFGLIFLLLYWLILLAFSGPSNFFLHLPGILLLNKERSVYPLLYQPKAQHLLCLVRRSCPLLPVSFMWRN